MRNTRRRQAKSLRYYHYISDTKLNMLFDQIDKPTLNRIGAEVKVDLKLASLTLHTVDNTDNTSPARSAKLKVVERFIEQHHHVGTVSDPGSEYFRGVMDMSWGWLWHWRERDGHAPGVIFMGRNETVVVLGGSRRHVLGVNSPADTNYPYLSPAPDLVNALGKHIVEDFSPEFGSSSRIFNPLDLAVNYSWNELSGRPLERLEFLAVLVGEVELSGITAPELRGTRGILGTPLYVAKARQPDPDHT